MKIKIVRPFSADKEVGETEQHYGVDFTVAETDSKQSVLVADIDDEEAQAMIDAGRAVADIDDEEAQAPKGKKAKAE